MDKKEYLAAIEKIVPDKEVKEKIRKQIFANDNLFKQPIKVRYSKRFIFGFVTAAFVIACVGILSVPAVATEIRSYIIKETPQYEPLTEAIETSVFTKCDDHIKVSVEEILSDGVVVDMTVKYTALDERGAEWLEAFEVYSSLGNYVINLQPYMPNTKEFGVNFSYGTFELEERATQTERVFLTKLQISGRTYSQNQGVFTFPLTQSVEKEMIDISGNVEIRSFRLQSPEVASEYYIPTLVEISPMSFVIYAQNHGVYERYTDGAYTAEKWLLPDEEIDSLEKNSYFVMRDGRKELLPHGAHNATYPKEENLYSDVMLYSERFYESAKGPNCEPKLMNLDEFEALVINGVRYELIQ